MAYKPTCLVCQKEMVLGFMTDQGHAASVNLPRWCEGEPKRGHFTIGDAKYAQMETGYKVVAYRCPQCEALRLYAPSTNQS
jgi:hypothetical protein